MAERGYWGTAAQGHQRYSRAYTINPHHLHRQVTVLSYDHDTGIATPVWRGFIHSDLETSRNGTRLVVRAIELQAAISQARINKGSEDYSIFSHDPSQNAAHGEAQSNRILPGPKVTGTVSPNEFKVHYKEFFQAQAHWGAFQVGEALVYAAYTPGLQWYRFEDDEQQASQTNIGSAPQLGSEFGDEIAPVYELFAIDRRKDTADGALAALADRRSSTARLANPFHPISICMALLQSSEAKDFDGFDVLGPDWGLGLPDDFFDLVEIQQTIDETLEAQIDHLVLGYDGKEVDAWSEIKSLNRTYGFFPARTATGLITFRYIRSANICDFANAPGLVAIPDTLQFSQARADSVSTISGRFNVLPWNDGRPFRAQIVDSENPAHPVPRISRRRGLFAQAREQQFDMPTRADIGTLASELLPLSKAKANQSPRLTLIADDIGYSIGDFARLSDLNVQEAWLPLPDGTVTLLEPTDVRWVGMIVGLDPDYERGRAAITLLLTNYATGEAARTRAPSAEVFDVTGADYDITTTAFTDGDDTQEFNIGDLVECWRADFALRSGTPGAPDVRVIQDLPAPKGTAAAGVMTLASAFTTPPIAGAGDIIRLAHLDDVDGYPEDGLSVPCDGFLAYCYIATTAGELGPNALTAHIYG